MVRDREGGWGVVRDHCRGAKAMMSLSARCCGVAAAVQPCTNLHVGGLQPGAGRHALLVAPLEAFLTTFAHQKEANLG